MEKLYRKLEEYSRSDYYPFHMPGHKRNPASVRGEFPLERDITEIEGFDNLHHPEDLLLEAQQNVAKLYGTRESFYSVNGSTAALLAAISAAVPRNGQILVARNCHKAVYHAIYLRNLKPAYIYPQMDSEWWINGGIFPDKVERCLAENPDMSRQDAFAESKRMMDGNKMDAFLLDLSFIGWFILGAITFNIVNILYTTPYMELAHAELYHTLKNQNN